jgi:hypothetical protein
MKKLFIALAVIIVALVGGVYYVFTNLDAIVESAIESAGTRTLGTEVVVGSVSLDLLGGSATIHDFSIANPAGFSDAAMASFSELSVSIDIQNMSADNIHIFSVVSRSPHILYESLNGTTNIETISARLASEEDATTEPAGSQPTLQVDSVQIENIRGTLIDDRLPRAVDVSLGDITLNNLNGTPNELAGEIMAPVLRQIATAAARALVEATMNIVSDVEDVRNRVDQARQRLDEAADAARNRLEGVLGGSNDDEEEQ